ncbi:MAG: hypothetical protein JSR00_01750 [Bacteroidetes bacterium]|nr:hypothetical protein [Bacteroidota bacterium]
MKAGNQKIMTLDFFALTVNNRAISLCDAFNILATSNNYLTAVSLIRLQLDNALRFFASTLVADSNDFVLHFLSGKEIRDYKDINGQKLSDNYLSKQLDKYFTGTHKLYKDTCSYIHLSERHFIPTMTTKGQQDFGFQINVGSSDNYKIDDKLDFAQTMFEVTKLVLIVVEQWKHEKERLTNLTK